MVRTEPDRSVLDPALRRGLFMGLAAALALAAGLVLSLPLPAVAAGKPAAPGFSPEGLPPPEWPLGPDQQLTEEQKKIDAAAFDNFKVAFDDLNKSASSSFNGPLFVDARKIDRGVVRLKSTAAWMSSGHMQQRSAMMVYRFWRTANRFLPVRVIITDDVGEDFMLIQDTPRGLDYLVRDRDAKP
jgi:hypothetical protein